MNKSKVFSKKFEQPSRAPPKIFGVYIPSILTTKVVLHITEVGKNVKQNLENKIIQKISNKCIPEGYVKPQSIKIQTYSAGLVPMSANITYTVIYECMVCYPVEGMIIEAKVKNITKAGFRCEVIDEAGNMPIIGFIIREHSVINEYFNSVKEEDVINIKVIGVTFELNDPYISIIGELHEDKSSRMHPMHKKQIQVKNTGGNYEDDESNDGDEDDAEYFYNNGQQL
jgi:DNA-directed RNA polymerase subunit E'/Rpb7